MDNNLAMFFESKKEEIVKATKKPLYEPNWENALSQENSIYVIWKDKKPIYVGETCNIKERIKKDLRNKRNHTFRSKMSQKHYKLSTEKLTDKLKREYEVSYIPILYGRKELEEYLILSWRKEKHKLINKKIVRALETYREYL